MSSGVKNAVEISQLRQRVTENLLRPDTKSWLAIVKSAKAKLDKAIATKDDTAANQLWFLHGVADAHAKYLSAFDQIGNAEYYKAWCDLEQIEIRLRTLTRNPFFAPASFRVRQLANTVRSWQGLYPYHIFFSPEFLIKHRECSICHQPMDPWSTCAHEKGKVYCGQECHATVRDVKLLAISLVKDPVQRYSVAFASKDENGRDQYDYSIVRFVADRLVSPFDGWTLTWGKAYHPHDLYAHVSAGDGCPCGSGRRYDSCCRKRPGVIRPHAQIVFAKPPRADLATTALSGYGERSSTRTVTKT